jgi:hypothetical protein
MNVLVRAQNDCAAATDRQASLEKEIHSLLARLDTARKQREMDMENVKKALDKVSLVVLLSRIMSAWLFCSQGL